MSIRVRGGAIRASQHALPPHCAHRSRSAARCSRRSIATCSCPRIRTTCSRHDGSRTPHTTTAAPAAIAALHLSGGWTVPRRVARILPAMRANVVGSTRRQRRSGPPMLHTDPCRSIRRAAQCGSEPCASRGNVETTPRPASSVLHRTVWTLTLSSNRPRTIPVRTIAGRNGSGGHVRTQANVLPRCPTICSVSSCGCASPSGKDGRACGTRGSLATSGAASGTSFSRPDRASPGREFTTATRWILSRTLEDWHEF